MSDESQIRQLLHDMVDAWNAGDATAYADIFTENADYVTWFGSHSSGREAIEESHRFLFAGPLKGTKLGDGSSGDGATVRFLTPDVAFVVSAGGMADSESVVTFTAVREPEADRWRFASFQNTRKQKIPGPPN
ncbi:SgcJ/EcaC family oxidoreductase [Streptomyces triticagri]|uniref:SgcJ/EcaC family oxidoreductase n=1 Tax=Streptomyces triticagri TaxID=2293568 RepID=A0A372LVA5_9ACTN|nr:SgcJ/EcaC family oxidoreductase [Streptomyces triticagri]RFU82479.1 SgcJ/EcaC family oxidoreductase [Streptomyces triticagri]